MQWCCAAGEWGLPHQLDLARWPYIQPRHLVRGLSSAASGLMPLLSASGLMPHPSQASPTLHLSTLCSEEQHTVAFALHVRIA